MSTSSVKANFNTNELITKKILKDKFFDYLNNKTEETLSQIYNKQGALSYAIQLSHVDTDYLNCTLELVGTNLATDGLGNFFDVDSDFAFCSNIPIHATGQSQTFDVALKYCSGPAYGIAGDTGVMSNVNTGIVQYTGIRDYIGEKGDPDSVTLISNDIKLNVNSLCDAGISFAGRQCLVYLKQPVSTVEAIAIQVLTVAWDGSNNTITVVSNKLGQSSASNVASDYECILLGPTIRDQNVTPLNNTTPYFYVGTMRSGTLTYDFFTDNITDQNVYEVDFDKISETVDNINRTITVDYTSEVYKPGIKSNPATLFTNACGTVYGDNIYIFGGSSNSTLTTHTTSVQKYNTILDSWSTLGTAFPDNYSIDAICARVGNKAYIFGGRDGSGTVTDLVRIFNLETETWSSGTVCPTAMRSGKWEIIDNQTAILFGEGYDSLSAPVANKYKYTIATNTWTVSAVTGANTLNYPPVLIGDGLEMRFNDTTSALFPVINIINTEDENYNCSFRNLFPGVITNATILFSNGIVYWFGGIDTKSNSTLTPTSNYVNDFYFAYDTRYLFRAHKNCIAIIENSPSAIATPETYETFVFNKHFYTWDQSLVVSDAVTPTVKYFNIPYTGTYLSYITNASGTNRSTYVMVYSAEDRFVYAKSKKTNIVADNKAAPTDYEANVRNITVFDWNGFATTIPEGTYGGSARPTTYPFFWSTYSASTFSLTNPYSLEPMQEFYYYPENRLFMLNHSDYYNNQEFNFYNANYKQRNVQRKTFDVTVALTAGVPTVTNTINVEKDKYLNIRFRIFNTGLITRSFCCTATTDPMLNRPQTIPIQKNQIYGDLIMSTQWNYSYTVLGDY